MSILVFVCFPQGHICVCFSEWFSSAHREKVLCQPWGYVCCSKVTLCIVHRQVKNLRGKYWSPETTVQNKWIVLHKLFPVILWVSCSSLNPKEHSPASLVLGKTIRWIAIGYTAVSYSDTQILLETGGYLYKLSEYISWLLSHSPTEHSVSASQKPNQTGTLTFNLIVQTSRLNQAVFGI